MSLMKLQHQDPSNVATAVKDLVGTKTERAEEIASLIALFKNDVRSCRAVCDKLGVDYKTFYQTMETSLTSSHGSFDALSQRLATMLKIKDKKSV